MAREIVFTNNDGSGLTAGEKGFTPFLLAHIDGVYGFENNVSISNNTMSDGGTYQGNVAKVRNIVIYLMDRPEITFNKGQKSRDVLYRTFDKNVQGTMTYIEDGEERVIGYRVESMTVSSADKRLYIISLLCDDPFFYAKYEQNVVIASVISAFEFPHEFVGYQEISYRSVERIATINNENANGNIGLNISISVKGNVTNPAVVHIQKGERIQVGSSFMPFSMVAGDTLLITTGTNNKHVFLTHNNVTSEVNTYITEDSEFIQLMNGINSIGYDADSGVENMVVSISYRFRYNGV